MLGAAVRTDGPERPGDTWCGDPGQSAVAAGGGVGVGVGQGEVIEPHFFHLENGGSCADRTTDTL